MRKIIVFLVVLFWVHLSMGQYYSTGQDRGSITWKEINTAQFQLVYPDYFEKQAQRLAQMLTALYTSATIGMDVEPRKVSIVLHTEAAKSNGYFAWAPRRGEFYTTPPDSGVTNDWLEHLATHEYRHVVQMDKLHEHIPNALNVIFGEQVVPFILGINVPMWFMEGDATLVETLLSKTGRGRSADFLQVLKAHLVQNDNWYGYDKANLGSYKDFVPSVYELGYYLVGNTYRNYGKKVWSNALASAGGHPYPWDFFARNSANEHLRQEVLKKVLFQVDSVAKQDKIFDSKDLGIRERWLKNKHRNHTITLYNDNLTELQARWRQEQTFFDTTAYQVKSSPKECYTNYMYPQLMDDGNILTLKSGYSDYSKFVVLKNKAEKLIYTPGYVTGRIQLSKSLLLWTEAIPDVRWQEASKNIIYCLDLKSGVKQHIRSDYSLSMPSFNHDNSRVLAIAKKHNYTQELVILDREKGTVLFSYNLGQRILTKPVFVSENQIAFIFTDEGSGIALLNIENGEEEVLLLPRNIPLADLTYKDSTLYFTAGFEGKNDIYAMNIADTKLQKLTESPFGAVGAFVKDGRMVYANYTSQGYEVAEISLKNALYQELEPTEWKDDFVLQGVRSQLKDIPKLKLVDSTFSSKPYKKGANLFNFHSRSPYSPPSGVDNGFDIAISTSSQNLLSTMFVNLGYRLKSGYDRGQVFANVEYKGWYPILSTELTYGRQKRHIVGLIKNKNIIDTALIKEKKGRWVWKTKATLPFDISRGKYLRHINLSAGLELTKDVGVAHNYIKGTDPNSAFAKGQSMDLGLASTHQLLSYEVFVSNLHKRSYRDLYSPLGQQFSFIYRHAPFDRKSVYSYAARGLLYFPSFFKHHGIKVYGGYQYQPHQSNYLFEDIGYPRGTTSVLARKKYTLMADYRFPLAYPDWNLGRALYVKRINTSLFYDYGLAEVEKYSFDTYSFGLEMTAETHFAQVPLPLEAGFRFGYESQSDKTFFSLLVAFAF